jgi:glutaredoxin 3
MTKKIIIYTTPTCVYCRMAKAFFSIRGVSFEEKNVLDDLSAEAEMLKKSGALVVPVIDVGGEILVGFHRERLREIFGEA